MVDFTAGMIAHHFSKDENYANAAKQLLSLSDESGELDYLFFDKLAPSESIGGFKKNENGTSIDDLDERGFLKNTTTDPRSVIVNLATIPKERLVEYNEMISRGIAR